MRFKKTSAQYLIFKTYIIYLKLRLLSHCLGSLNTQNHGPVEEVSRVESESLDHGEREIIARALSLLHELKKFFISSPRSSFTRASSLTPQVPSLFLLSFAAKIVFLFWSQDYLISPHHFIFIFLMINKYQIS